MTKIAFAKAVEVTFPFRIVHRSMLPDGRIKFDRTEVETTIELECPECNGMEFRLMYSGSATYDEFVDTNRDKPWPERRHQSEPEYVEGSFEPNDDGWWCMGCNSTTDEVLGQALDWYRDYLLSPKEFLSGDILDRFMGGGKERQHKLEELHAALTRYLESKDE